MTGERDSKPTGSGERLREISRRDRQVFSEHREDLGGHLGWLAWEIVEKVARRWRLGPSELGWLRGELFLELTKMRAAPEGWPELRGKNYFERARAEYMSEKFPHLVYSLASRLLKRKKEKDRNHRTLMRQWEAEYGELDVVEFGGDSGLVAEDICRAIIRVVGRENARLVVDTYLGGISVPQVAERMGISTGAANARRGRAMSRLAEDPTLKELACAMGLLSRPKVG